MYQKGILIKVFLLTMDINPGDILLLNGMAFSRISVIYINERGANLAVLLKSYLHKGYRSPNHLLLLSLILHSLYPLYRLPSPKLYSIMYLHLILLQLYTLLVNIQKPKNPSAEKK